MPLLILRSPSSHPFYPGTTEHPPEGRQRLLSLPTTHTAHCDTDVGEVPFCA